MSTYFADYKRERTHDGKLINVVRALAEQGQTELIKNHLLGNDFPDLGELIDARLKRDFDVLLEFTNCNLIIESKVDSVESQLENWQTENIYNKYSERWKNERNVFLYFTYGHSEFYIKKRQNGIYETGAYSIHFKHIKCEDIFLFLKAAENIRENPSNELKTWAKWLEFELTKRKDNSKYLGHLAEIIEHYKQGLQLTDYPVSRMNLFAPEFTIPFYYVLSSEWNKRNNQTIGKVCLYSLGRGYSPVFDSIINFHELWQDKKPLSCNGILNGEYPYLYFEFNEDFNLHLKADSETPDIQLIIDFVSENTNKFTLDKKYNGAQEYYKQGSYVLFEWDLKILVTPIEENMSNIESVLLNAIEILS